MLKLCGVHLSNYHNKVRIALLEKGVPFEEDATCAPSQKDKVLARSPLGEEAYPEKPLLPRDPFERAKVRELITFIEWYAEMVARRLYGHAECPAFAKVNEDRKAAQAALATRAKN
jgi:glutathione S-transferase